MRLTQRRRAVLLLFYLVALFWLALRPSSMAAVQWINIVPLSSIAQGVRQGGALFIVNILGNVIVFVPLGLLLPMIDPRCAKLWRTLLVGLAVSLAIELLQLASAQRVADIDDLLLNVVGTGLGYIWYARSR